MGKIVTIFFRNHKHDFYKKLKKVNKVCRYDMLLFEIAYKIMSYTQTNYA